MTQRCILREWPVLLAFCRVRRRDTPLLMIGHNPGLEQLAIALRFNPGCGRTGAARKARAKISHGALAVLDFESALGRREARHGKTYGFRAARGHLAERRGMNAAREGQGRTALITGASAGIGMALARVFAAMDLIVC
jgi:hypothetical protein